MFALVGSCEVPGAVTSSIRRIIEQAGDTTYNQEARGRGAHAIHPPLPDSESAARSALRAASHPSWYSIVSLRNVSAPLPTVLRFTLANTRGCCTAAYAHTSEPPSVSVSLSVIASPQSSLVSPLTPPCVAALQTPGRDCKDPG